MPNTSCEGNPSGNTFSNWSLEKVRQTYFLALRTAFRYANNAEMSVDQHDRKLVKLVNSQWSNQSGLAPESGAQLVSWNGGVNSFRYRLSPFLLPLPPSPFPSLLFLASLVGLFSLYLHERACSQANLYGGPQLSRQKLIPRGKRKLLTAKENYPRQKEKPRGKKKKTRDKKKNLTQKEKDSRQKEKTHGKKRKTDSLIISKS